jgi:hypothetical protein
MGERGTRSSERGTGVPRTCRGGSPTYGRAARQLRRKMSSPGRPSGGRLGRRITGLAARCHCWSGRPTHGPESRAGLSGLVFRLGVQTQAVGLGCPPVGPSGLRVCVVRSANSQTRVEDSAGASGSGSMRGITFTVRFAGSRGWTSKLYHRGEMTENTLDGRPFRPI